MIKMISACDHANIGDHRTSRLLANLIHAWSGIEVELYGYRIPLEEPSIVEFNTGDAVIVGPGGVFLDFGKHSLFSFSPKSLAYPTLI